MAPACCAAPDRCVHLIVEEVAVGEMTINGELNKLAQNVESGRMFAGVHYRSDAHGLLLGEEYALSYLADVLTDYGTGFQRDRARLDGDDLQLTLTVETFAGRWATITSGKVAVE